MDMRNGLDRQGADDLGDLLGTRLKGDPTETVRSAVTRSLPSSGPPQPTRPPAILQAASSTFVQSRLPNNAFRRIAALGFSALLPIVPPGAPLNPASTLSRRLAKGGDARGKSPGMLRAAVGWSGCDWQRLHALPSALDTWHGWGAGVGLRLGDDRVAAVDFDLVDPALCESVFERFRVQIPFSHKPRIGRAPKMLVLVRIDGTEPIDYRRVDFADGQRVELLGTRRQCVVDGIHPVTGRPYTWPEGMPRLDELPRITEANLTDAFKALASMPGAVSGVLRAQLPSERSTRDQATLRGSLSMVRSAVAALPNTTEHFPTRDAYIKVGIAIKAALPDDPLDAFEIYDDWCSRWEDPPPGAIDPTETADDDWSRMHPPFVIGAGWLFAQARRLAGWSVDPAEYFGPIEATSTSLWDAAPAVAATSDARPPTFRRIDGSKSGSAIPIRQWLIHPWCPALNVNIVLGAPAVSKSTFMLMIAAAVATGDERILRGAERLCGQRLHRSGKVVVYNAEDDLDEMDRRLAGVRTFHGINRFKHEIVALSGVDGGEDRLIITERREKNGSIVRGSGFARLQAIILEEQPTLVILDPLVALSRGLAENSNDEMEILLAHLRQLARSGNTTILVAHHTAKSADRAGGDLNASRGASSIIAAVRGGISLTKQLVTAETKQEGDLRGLPPGWYVLAKDVKTQFGDAGQPTAYRLKPVPVGNGTSMLTSDIVPAGAQLLFDEDPEEYLRQVGDYVAVHEIVDRRDVEALARETASRRAGTAAQQIAEIVLAQLGDRPEAFFNTEFEAIGVALQAQGLMRGTSRQRISDKLQNTISRGVVVEKAGVRLRVCMTKDIVSRTASWILRAEHLEWEGGDGGLSNLFD